MEKPRIGIAAYGLVPSDAVQLGIHAERLGFDGIWFGEHYIIPQHYAGHHPTRDAAAPETRNRLDDVILGHHVPIPDPWQLLAAIASQTSRLRIGTAISILPMNHPLLLARATVTTHDLSGGRLSLGVGAGWLQEEFDAVGIPFQERGSRLEETIAILRKSWAGGFFEHSGKHFEFKPLQITAKPVRVPVVCGGNTPLALRRAARIGDAWMNSSNHLPLEELIALRTTLEEARAKAGTAARSFTYYVRPPSIERKEIDRYLAAGFSELVLPGPRVWPSDGSIALEDKVAGLARVAKALEL
jgi:probable F420-dependent oxidoreductase